MPTKFKFYFIVTNLTGGGAEKAVLKIARAISSRGHDTKIILLENRQDYSPNPIDDVILVSRSANISKGWFGRRLAAAKLRLVLSRLPRPDLVISTLPFSDEVTSLARVSNHVARVANTLGMEVKSLMMKSFRKAERRKAKYQKLYGNRRLVAVSEGVAHDLRETILCCGEIDVIPNLYDSLSIRAQSFEPASLPADFPRNFVVHAGRFVPQKRHDLLLDAWQKEPQLPMLVLLTDSSPELQTMISERKLEARVYIAGFQRNPYAFYRRANCLVLCSDYEGLPNVLLEALACGTPVISTNCPSGPSEILRNYPECLVPLNNSSALAHAVQRCLLSPPDVANYDFSKYLPDKIAEQWESLITTSE